MSRIYFYNIYGLNIASQLLFPELEFSKGNSNYDVIICFDIGDDFPNGTVEEGSNSIKHDFNDIVFVFDEKPIFRVRYGNEIVINSDFNLSEVLLRSLILGQAMGILTYQRGYLILHGSAVNIDGNAVAFLGGCGEGKSTTAAALNKRGHSLITDDVLVIDFDEDNNPMVLPSFPRIKLWDDVIKVLADDCDLFTKIDPEFDKYSYIVNKSFQTNQLPLKMIYILENSEKTAINSLKSQEALIKLIQQSYTFHLFDSEDKTKNLFQCAKVITNLQLKSLKICRS
jgi:hypothetical protein